MELLSRAGPKKQIQPRARLTGDRQVSTLVGLPTSLPLHPTAGSISRACLLGHTYFTSRSRYVEGDLKASTLSNESK